MNIRFSLENVLCCSIQNKCSSQFPSKNIHKYFKLVQNVAPCIKVRKWCMGIFFMYIGPCIIVVVEK